MNKNSNIFHLCLSDAHSCTFRNECVDISLVFIPAQWVGMNLKKYVCNRGDTVLCHGGLHTDSKSVQSRELGQLKKYINLVPKPKTTTALKKTQELKININ